MTSRDFCYWLQGYFEIACTGPTPPEPNNKYNLSDRQIEMIRNHLNMVFKHEIDPSMGSPSHQAALSDIHGAASAILTQGPRSDIRINC